MTDQYGRSINYMRISVTDRCNLRCVYCMPAEGVEQISHSEILTYQEITRIARIAAGLGITRIKLTGGEPLVRRELHSLVSMLTALDQVEEVTLTTNGILLGEQIAQLAAAGIQAVNVSLDTLDREQYRAITRRDGLEKVLASLEKMKEFPQIRVKLNCVPLAGDSQEQWCSLAKLAKDREIDVRFIEMMPVGLGKNFPLCSQEEVLRSLRDTFGSEKKADSREAPAGNGPASYVTFEGFRGRIGFISSLSHKFCGECNRVRLSAEGFLKPCLQYAEGTDLRRLLRQGASDQEIRSAIRQTVWEKPACHQFGRAAEEGTEQKNMNRIGG